MLEYSDYKSFVDTLEQSNHENTYQEVMKKEERVLDTMNKVIKHYKDQDIKERQFVNLPISLAVYRFFSIWTEIMDEILKDGMGNILQILNKEDRLVYIGVMFVFLSIILYYVEITR